MLTIFIGGAIVRAYVISKLWEWFVAPPSTPSQIMIFSRAGAQVLDFRLLCRSRRVTCSTAHSGEP